MHNFLATLTSRYSDFDGYWMLGLVVEDLEGTTIDLLGTSDAGTAATPLSAFIRAAREKFQDQLAKHSIPISHVSSGVLEIARQPAQREGSVSGHVRSGYDVAFTVRARSDLHTDYMQKTTIFVAPHDPSIEVRSTRGSSGP